MENQEMNPTLSEINVEPTNIVDGSENLQVGKINEPIQEPMVKVEAEAEKIDRREQEEPERTEILEISKEEEEQESSESVPICLETVMAMFSELSQKFDEKIARDSHKNALFDKMYAELNSYRNDLYQKILKPFVMDTIMLIDQTNMLIRDMDKTNVENVLNVLSDIPLDLQDILERNGIETFYDETDTFNPRTQKVLRTVSTDNPELDNKIESRVRHGYKWDGKVIKPEMIQCYKYSQTN